MFTFILVFLGFSFLILAHEAGHFFMARKFNMKVEEFGFGLPPRIWGKKRGETIYSINLLPFGGFVRIAGETDKPNDDLNKEIKEEDKKRFFYYQKPRNKALVTIAGVLVNFFIGWILISLVFMIGQPFSVIIGKVMPNSAASRVGILEGDLILNFSNEDDLKDYISSNPNKEITLNIQRGKDKIEVKLIPELKDGKGFAGIAFSGGEIKKERPDKALIKGLITSAQIVKMNAIGFYNLVTNLIQGKGLIEGVMGPVGIVSFSKKIGDANLIYLLNLFGIISISLAFINLMPFPALDGGRLLFVLIEKIKGSPVSYKIESIINGIGFALLLLLIVVITFRDVKNLF
jgi:regulator of sigma E protease